MQINSVAQLVKIEPSIAEPKPFTTKELPATTSASLKIQAFINQSASAAATKNVKIVPASDRKFMVRIPAPIPNVVSRIGNANVIISGRKKAFSRLITIATQNSDRKLS